MIIIKEAKEKIYKIKVVRRKTTKATITIKNKKSITITVDKRVKKSQIEEIIERKFSWIEEQIKKMELIKHEIDFIFLGHKKEIIFNKSQEGFCLMKNKIEVNSFFENNKLHLFTELDRWLKYHAEFILSKIVDKQIKRFSKYEIPKFTLKLRKMKNRLGTCYSTRFIINLNWLLIKLPLECIEFVAVHEIAHFIEPNHSSNFYKLMTAVLPDWKERMNKIKKTNFYSLEYLYRTS